jgi:hypothetical protein
MLYEHREKCSAVANDVSIRDVMDNKIKYFEFTPGVRSYNIEDIKKFLHDCRK